MSFPRIERIILSPLYNCEGHKFHECSQPSSRARSAGSGAPWVKKCDKLPIRQNFEITWPYTDRPSAPQAYQCKIIQSTGTATQMQRKEIAWPPERKNNNKVVSFSTLFLMFTLTWITEKELKRVIENKRDEFCRKKNMKIQSGSKC